MIHRGVRRATFQVSFMIHRSYHNHHATYLPMDPYGGIPQMGTFIGRWETIKTGWYPILRQNRRGIGTGDLWHWKLGSSYSLLPRHQILRITPPRCAPQPLATATRKKMMPGQPGQWQLQIEAFLSLGCCWCFLRRMIFHPNWHDPNDWCRTHNEKQRQFCSLFVCTYTCY